MQWLYLPINLKVVKCQLEIEYLSASAIGVVISSSVNHTGSSGPAYKQFGSMPKMEVHTLL